MDQVPLPIVIVLDDTWDTRGSHGPVCYSQPGDGSENIFSVKLLFFQRGIKPNFAVNFGGTVRVIVDFDKKIV